MASLVEIVATFSHLAVVVVMAAVKSIIQGPSCTQTVIPSARLTLVLIGIVLVTTVVAENRQRLSENPASGYHDNGSNSDLNYNKQQSKSTSRATNPKLRLLYLDRDTDYHQGPSLERGDYASRSKSDNVPAASTLDSTSEDVEILSNFQDPTDTALGPTPATDEVQLNSTVASADGKQHYQNRSNNKTNLPITHLELQMEPEEIATGVDQTGGLDDRLAIRLQKPSIATSDLAIAYENEPEYDNRQQQQATYNRQQNRNPTTAVARDQDPSIVQSSSSEHYQPLQLGNSVVYNDDTGEEERIFQRLHHDELIPNLYSRQPTTANSTSTNLLQQRQSARLRPATEVQPLGVALRNKQVGKAALNAARGRLALPQPYHQVPTLLPPYSVVKGSNHELGPSYQSVQDIGSMLMPIQSQHQHQLQQQQQLHSPSLPKPQRDKIPKKRSQLADDKLQQQPVAAAASSTKKPRGLFKVSGSRQHPTIINEDPFRMVQSQQLSLIPLPTGSNNQILGIIGALPASQVGLSSPGLAVGQQSNHNKHPIGIGQFAHSDYHNSNRNLHNNQQTFDADGYGGYSTRYLYSPRSQYSGNRNSYQPIAHVNKIGGNFLHRTGFVTSPATGYQTADDGSPGAQASSVSSSTSEPMWSDSRHQEDDYQQSPQTIQITAVPNGLGLNNGFVNNGWNGWNGGLNGGWNGRQVLLVNRQPQLASQWRDWMLPVAIVLALPLLLGALFLPVMLKSVMFLIQILQMLGLLMPPAQLAGHIASVSHNSPAG